MSLIFHAFWLLCGIGAVVFAATAIRGWRSAGIAVAAFALAAWLAVPALPDPVWLGALAALAAVLGLGWPRHWMLTSAVAGMLAGAWSGLLASQSIPWPAALMLAAAVPALAAWRARRETFAPPALRDEALLLTFVLALAIAVAPGVLAGWNAALRLNIPADAVRPAIPAWAFALGAASLLSGSLLSLWSRR